MNFVVGDRVRIVARLLRGRTGRLVRPARLIFKKAWLVELDGGSRWTFRRTRVAEAALQKIDAEPGAEPRK